MSTKPIRTFSIAPVRLSIWLNEANGKHFPTFALDRRYEDKDGNWQSSSSYNLLQLSAVKELSAHGLRYWMQQGGKILGVTDVHGAALDLWDDAIEPMSHEAVVTK